MKVETSEKFTGKNERERENAQLYFACFRFFHVKERRKKEINVRNLVLIITH